MFTHFQQGSSQVTIAGGGVTTGQATVTIMNMDNPLEYLSVVGRLDEDTTDGAEDVIDELARKYTGDDFGRHPGEQRVTFRLSPARVTHRGG